MPSIMWVGLIQSVEVINRAKTDLPKQEGVLPVNGLQIQTATTALSWVSSLPAYPVDFGLPDSLHNHPIRPSLLCEDFPIFSRLT